MDLNELRKELSSSLPGDLVDELLEAHSECKKAFYLGGLRLAEVEGGRFSEAAFRLLESHTTSQHTPLGLQLDTQRIISKLANLTGGSYPDAIRLHIPRCLRVVYDIRNNRDAAHLGDGIDPNLQDATLVIATIDWVLAELIRLFHTVTADEASKIVEDLVSKSAPLVQDFGGYLKVLNSNLSASETCLVLLYHRGSQGADYSDLKAWARPNMVSNLRRTLHRLEHDKAHVHSVDDRYVITRLGEIEVESQKLYSFD